MPKTVDNIAWSNKKIIDTLETYHSSYGKVAVKVPVKLGMPMFRYLVTSFKCCPKGVSSSG